MAPALLALAALSACDRAPAAEANPAFADPTVTEDAGVRLVGNAAARETLLVGEGRPARSELLFLGRRATSPGPAGTRLWADTESDRVIAFDPGGAVRAILQGAPASGPALSGPLFAVANGADVLAVVDDGRALRFVDGSPSGWTEAAPAPPSAAHQGRLYATRTVRSFDLGPAASGTPLAWELNGDLSSVAHVGELTPVDNPYLGSLVNTGWLAAGADGALLVASAVRPEVRRFAADRSAEWVATLPLDHDPPPEPRLGVSAGSVTPIFQEVVHGVAVGPDGRAYALGPGPGERDRLWVLDATGALERTGTVPRDAGIFVDRGGRVTVVPREEALTSPGADERADFPDFNLPSLSGPESIRLADFAGDIVVVNFWASWCGPCRREMPQLDSLAVALAGTGVSVVGLNDDEFPDQAIGFAQSLGGVSYPLARGEGDLRQEFGYRGLPYTVVLDREHRVVRAFYGFGESIDALAAVVEGEAALDR